MGTAWEWTMKGLADDIKKTLSVDKDFTIVISGFPGCLPKDTLVKTPQGLKKIYEVNGKVLSYNFKTHRIEEKKVKSFNSGNKKVFKIHTPKRIIKCSPEHKWIILRDGEKKTIQTRDLTTTDFLFKHLKKIEKIEILKIEKTNEVEPMFDLEVRDNHNFILEDGIITHNSGKSTLAFHLAKNIDENFDIKKQMIFTRQDLIDAANTLPPRSAIVVDEAVAVLFRRDFANTKQKAILKILDIIRYKQYCIIFCVPNFWSLDSHLLTRIRTRFHIEKRGLSMIFSRSNNPWDTDCWNQKMNQKLMKNWDYRPDARRAKGFMGILHFGDMPQYAKDLYLPLKDEKKLLREKEDNAPKQSDKMKRMVAHRAILVGQCMELGMSQKKIADVLGVSQAAISKDFIDIVKHKKEAEEQQKMNQTFNPIKTSAQ